MSIQTINPATGDVLKTFDPTSAAEVERCVARAHAAFAEWRCVSFGERAQRMRAAAGALRASS